LGNKTKQNKNAPTAPVQELGEKERKKENEKNRQIEKGKHSVFFFSLIHYPAVLA
jgi:hypothetical protein